MSDLKLSAKELESLNQFDLESSDENQFFEEPTAEVKQPTTPRTRARPGSIYAHKFDTLTQEANSVCDVQEAWDGLRFEYNRHVSDRLTLVHICQGGIDLTGQGQDPGEYVLVAQSLVNLDDITPFGKSRVSIAGEDAPARASPNAIPKNKFLGVARYGSRGDWMSRLQVSSPSTVARLMCSGRGRQSNFQAALEYSGRQSYMSLQLSTNQGIVASYVGEIYNSTRHNQLQIHCGGQLNYVHSQAASALALVARIDKGPAKSRHSVTVMASDSPSPLSNLPGIAQLCYARKLDNNITWASRLLLMRNQNSDLYGFMAHASVGFDYKFNSGSVKGSIDSSGRLVVINESIISPLMSFSCCIDADYGNKEYKGGVALQFHL